MPTKSPFRGENKTYLVALPGTGSTSGTYGATLIWKLDKSETTNLAGHPNKKELSITIASKIRNEDWNTFCSNYVQNVNTDSFTQEYEDGTKDTITSVPSGTKLIGVIHVDAKLDSKRVVTVFAGVPSGETGSFNTANNSLGDTPIEIKAVACPYAWTYDAVGFYALASDILATGTPGTALDLAVGDFGKRILYSAA